MRRRFTNDPPSPYRAGEQIIAVSGTKKPMKSNYPGMKTKKCVVCGNIFMFARNNAEKRINTKIYCSGACKQKAYRNRKFGKTPSRKTRGFIYILQDEQGLCKIGMTSQLPACRAIEIVLKEKRWMKLIFYKYIEDAPRLEKEIHALFGNKRIKGEWFQLSLDDIDVIKQYKNFDTKTQTVMAI